MQTGWEQFLTHGRPSVKKDRVNEWMDHLAFSPLLWVHSGPRPLRHLLMLLSPLMAFRIPISWFFGCECLSVCHVPCPALHGLWNQPPLDLKPASVTLSKNSSVPSAAPSANWEPCSQGYHSPGWFIYSHNRLCVRTKGHGR